MLSKLAKLSPLIGSLLIFLGILKLTIYYSFFGISIVEFLSLPEILTSFLDDLNILLVFILVMIIQTLPLANYIHKKSNSGLSIDEFFAAFFKYIYPYRYKIALLFFTIGITLFMLIYFEAMYPIYFIIYLIIVCLIQMSTYLLMSKDESGEIEISESSMLIAVLISLSFAIYLFAIREARDIQSMNQDVKIETNDFTIVCDSVSKNIYIGKTNEYVFVKLNPTSSTLVLPSGKIESIEIKSGN